MQLRIEDSIRMADLLSWLGIFRHDESLTAGKILYGCRRIQELSRTSTKALKMAVSAGSREPVLPVHLRESVRNASKEGLPQ